MNRIAHFVYLDYCTIKPYKQSFYILVFVALVMGIVIKSISSLPGIIMMGLLLTMSFPFSVVEKNGMDTLYATLPIKRKNVVTGRYVFVLCVEIFGVVFALLLSAALSAIFSVGLNITETLFSLCLLSAAFSLVVSLQYPIYFKLGYTKAQVFAYIPLLITFLFVAIGPTLLENLAPLSAVDILWKGILASPYLMYALPVAAGLLVLALSCALSRRLYANRDI